MKVDEPIVVLIPDNKKEIDVFKSKLNEYVGKSNEDYILNYPTVYIHNWEKKDKYEVYVGETNDFFQRTDEHFACGTDSNSWQNNILIGNAFIYVIAHKEFNKSLTLDIENKLMHYLSSCSSVVKVHNGRGNPQNKYFPCDEFETIFSKIWKKLRSENEELFLSESEIKDSAIYKASPLHKLNNEQLEAKEKIITTIVSCLNSLKEEQLIFVQGNAGTGKTVLMNSLFYYFAGQNFITSDFNNKEKRIMSVAIVVNHDDQLVVYEQIVKKLDLGNGKEQLVFNPTQLINLFKDRKNSPIKRKEKYDIIFVDEAHLLLTQKNQAYLDDDNQLDEILKCGKVVVAMFDNKQILNAEQYLDRNTIDRYINKASENGSYIELKIQMRMKVNKELQNWFQNVCENGIIDKLPRKTDKYDIKIFDNPNELEMAIKSKALNEKTALSRMIATYDWEYKSESKKEHEKNYCVKIGNWERPWNRELIKSMSTKESKKLDGLAWAEQPQTIGEIGSTYTIQGFDLNYAGVIIGPSVKYRNGKIVFDPSCSKNMKAVRKRTLSDGTKESFGEDFLKNEFGVLMTRGVNGLYIYACDNELREKLKECI